MHYKGKIVKNYADFDVPSTRLNLLGQVDTYVFPLDVEIHKGKRVIFYEDFRIEKMPEIVYLAGIEFLSDDGRLEKRFFIPGYEFGD